MQCNTLKIQCIEIMRNILETRNILTYAFEKRWYSSRVSIAGSCSRKIQIRVKRGRWQTCQSGPRGCMHRTTAMSTPHVLILAWLAVSLGLSWAQSADSTRSSSPTQNLSPAADVAGK